MPKRAHDPGDEAGRLDPIGPHGPNPPSRGQVSSGDADAEAEVNFDDDQIYSGTGNNARRDGTSKKARGPTAGNLARRRSSCRTAINRARRMRTGRAEIGTVGERQRSGFAGACLRFRGWAFEGEKTQASQALRLAGGGESQAIGSVSVGLALTRIRKKQGRGCLGRSARRTSGLASASELRGQGSSGKGMEEQSPCVTMKAGRAFDGHSDEGSIPQGMQHGLLIIGLTV